MTDQVKEAVFNVLKPYFFEGCLFLDLFSGTGSLSMEALSRGAGQAHAVEKHPSCIDIIKKNSKLLPQAEKLKWYKKNVFSFIEQSKNLKITLKAFDIIIADPPFNLQAGEKIIKSLENNPLVKKGTVLVIETSPKENLKNNYSGFYLFSKKIFNDKKIWFYECQPN